MTSGSLSVQDSGMAIRQACAHAAKLFKAHGFAPRMQICAHILDAAVACRCDGSPPKSTALNI
jgi:nicotinate dehydrogenase subunit B